MCSTRNPGAVGELGVDLAGVLGAAQAASVQVLTLYIPDKDRDGGEFGTQRNWVLEAAELLALLGGGVTIMPPGEARTSSRRHLLRDSASCASFCTVWAAPRIRERSSASSTGSSTGSPLSTSRRRLEENGRESQAGWSDLTSYKEHG